jgi:hypothetical protein
VLPRGSRRIDAPAIALYSPTINAITYSVSLYFLPSGACDAKAAS